MNLILASGSPRRKELLEQLGLKFEIMVSDIDENIDEADPIKLVEKLAAQKAEAVAQNLSKGLIIGADTIVEIEGQVLGKPGSPAEAKKMLLTLNGRVHRVITGLAVCNAETQESILDHQITLVTFRKLREEEIDSYVGSKDPLDKAGAYGIQSLGSILVEKIDGCYTNVVGLPLTKLYELLNRFNYHILK